MDDKIVNKVANSGLITIDLSTYFPKLEVLELDIKDFLFEGIVLKEKIFRATLKEFDFIKYKDKIVALFCSSDAIIPMWSYMLISSYLNPICFHVYFGTKENVIQKLILKNINSIDENEFLNKKVIVKGCASMPISEALYVAITQKLQNHVASLMFGEACSAVPIYKKR